MALESTKFFITTYVIFIGILLFLNLGGQVDFDLQEPPQFSGAGILGTDLVTAIDEAKSSNVIGFIIGGAVEIIAFLISVIVFGITFIFYIGSLLLFTIENQPFINLILIIYRVLFLLEIIPYVKNLLHPTQAGTH